MPGLPLAQLMFVDREPGLTRFDVLCPYCRRVHHHPWLGTETRFSVNAPCSPGQRYRIRLSHIQRSRDDNAMHEYENNWIE